MRRDRIDIEGREVLIQVVDPQCSTIRNRTRWPTIRPEWFHSLLWSEAIHTVLITPTDPVKIVCVWSTFPTIVAWSYQMPLERWWHFYNELSRRKPDGCKVNWKLEGF